jgi:sulfofructose kinase
MGTREKSATARRAVDVVGVGINATDTIIRLPHLPTIDTKIELLSDEVKAGGQVASAMVACRRWGLRTRYVGKIADDAAGAFQRAEMRREKIESHWITAKGCASQIAYILVDEPSGERTVLWKRDSRIALRPSDLKREWIAGARALLVDGHDTEAASKAARWARAMKIAVIGDFDNCYPGVEALLEYVDFPVTSRDFPGRLTGEANLLHALPLMHARFDCRLTCATIGRLGAIAWDGSRFLLARGYRVNAIDTTGAGDIFHGGFLYGLLRDWSMEETLDFSCAAAALNCTAPGARGGIAPLEHIEDLRNNGVRSEMAYTKEELRIAADEAKGFARAGRSGAAKRATHEGGGGKLKRERRR